MIKKIIFLSALILLVLYGSFQVQRYIYKSEIISQIKANKGSAPVLASNLDELKKAIYKNVKLKGQFISDKPIYYYALKNNTPGYEIILPFELENSKEYVLINTGWGPSKRSPKSYEKKVEISGFLIHLPRKYIISFQNDTNQNLWFDLSPRVLSKYLGKEVGSILILLDTKQYLAGERIEFNIDQVTNNHLGYAITWFSLAIALVVIYKLMRKR